MVGWVFTMLGPSRPLSEAALLIAKCPAVTSSENWRVIWGSICLQKMKFQVRVLNLKLEPRPLISLQRTRRQLREEVLAANLDWQRAHSNTDVQLCRFTPSSNPATLGHRFWQVGFLFFTWCCQVHLLRDMLAVLQFRICLYVCVC